MGGRWLVLSIAGLSACGDESPRASGTDGMSTGAAAAAEAGPTTDASSGSTGGSTDPETSATTTPDPSSSSSTGCVSGEEICDGLDNDCDGEVDEDVPSDGAGCLDPGPPEFPDMVDLVHITVETATATNAGTDDPIEVCLGALHCFPLNILDWNDRELGQRDVVLLEGLGVARDQLDRFELTGSDGADRWEPEAFEVAFDGELVYCRDDLDIYIGTGAATELPTWTDPDGFSPHCATIWPQPLTHAVMVGAPEPDSARLWYRTHATRQVQLRVATSEAALADAPVVDYGYPAAANDFAEVVEVVGLQPATQYWFDLEIDGERQGAWSFTTAPARGESGTWAFAMGSCAGDEDQPIFSAIAAAQPDLFVFLGDNHYANSDDLASLRQYYRWSLERPERGAFVPTTPVLATWDDHDYVGNNTTAISPGRDVALRAFTEYWANASYGTDATPGVFGRHVRGDVEFFLIDDRYHRGLDDSITGAAQEAWLLDALSESEATFKFVVNGSQYTLTRGVESWGEFPEAQTRLREHIANEEIGGVVLVSGDVHRSEFRLLPGAEGGYALPELTSSPLARSNSPCPSNPEILACEDTGDFFVHVEIDTTVADPSLTATIRDAYGAIAQTWTILRSELE